MAVTSVYAYSVRGGRTQDGRRDYEVVYKVTTDSKLDDPIKVFAGSNIPQYADAYTFGTSQDLGVSMQTMECDYWERETTSTLFRVTCTYSNRPTRGGRGGSIDITQSQDDPTLFAPRIYGSFVSELVPLTHEVVPPYSAIVNPLGERIRGAEISRSHRALNIELTKRTFSGLEVEPPVMNSVAFFGGAAKTWKLESAEFEQVYYGATKYYEVRYSFLYDSTGWDFKPKVEGTFYQVSGITHSVASDTGFAYGDGYINLNEAGELTSAGVPLFYGVPPCTLPAWTVLKSIDYGAVLGVPTSL